MKRQTAKTQATKDTTEKSYVSLPLYDKAKREVVNKTCTRYHMGEGVSMDICEGDSSDYGSLNIYGVVIKISIREIAKGKRKGELFVSYPQYKTKDGEYNAYVTNYSKALNEAIKNVLSAHYDGEDGFISVPAGEEDELPFN